MQTRPFGQSGPRVAEIGLGTWQFGGDWGEVAHVTALAILATAAREGATFIDTADIYGMGVSEDIVGLFGDVEGDLFVATKLGQWPEPDGEQYRLDVMRRHVEASLTRLKTDCLDLAQLHCIAPEELRRGEVFEHLRALRQEGKLRGFGASVETIEDAFTCLEQPELSSLQIIFNLFRQEAADELLPRAKERGVSVIVRLPLASGMLADKFSADSTFTDADHRHYNRDGQEFNVGETFAGLPFERGLALTARLREFVPEGWSMSELALRWILDHEGVTTVIPGASNPDQVAANCAASARPPLSAESHEALGRFFREEVSPHVRGQR